MKIRIGFVSNSSSTSFTLTMKKEEMKSIIAGLPEKTRSLIAKRLRPEYGKFLGFEITTLQGTCNGESFDYNDDCGVTLEEIMFEIHKLAQSRKMDCLFSTESC